MLQKFKMPQDGRNKHSTQEKVRRVPAPRDDRKLILCSAIGSIYYALER